MAVESRGSTSSRLGRSLMAVPFFLLLGTIVILMRNGGETDVLGQISRRVGSDGRAGVVNDFGPWRETIETFISPETADAIERDRQLRRSVGAAVDFTRGLTKDLAERFELPSLMEASDSLALVRKNLEGGGTRGTPTTPGSPSLSKRQQLFPSVSGLPGIPGITAPLFGGSTKPDATKDANAPATSTEASGGGLLAGLGNKALDAILSPLKDAVSGITSNLAGAGMFLGIGIGAGAAQGLNLSSADSINKLAAKIAADNGHKATGLNPTIQSLGQGASAAIIGALNVTGGGGGGGALKSFNITSLLGGEALSSVALKFADGLGSGAASGLKLGGNNTQVAAPPSGSKASDVAGAFAFGLTNSLTRSVDLSGGLSGITGGKGLDLSAVGNIFPGINLGSVAQGFARGFLQGASDSIEAMGGIKSLMNGTARIPTTVPNGTIGFNDTVGGASSGFGQGLGGQGVLVATQLVAEAFPNVVSTKSSNQAGGKVTSRSLDVVLPRQLGGGGGNNGQGVTIGFGPSLNLSAIINAATVSSGLQTIVDLLRCEGISGFFLILSGLKKSGTLPNKSGDINTTLGPNVTATIRDIIPNGTISFVNSGNRFEIEGQLLLNALVGSISEAADGIKINGNKLITFAALLIVHILIAVLVFVAVLPLAMGLEGARSILSRAQLPQALPRRTPRWVGILWLFVTVPSLVLIVVFGALVAGDKPGGHFRTAHSIVGLVAVILGIPATALYYADSRLPDLKARITRALGGGGDQAKAEMRFILLRALSNQVFQTLGTSAVLTGFADLAAVSLCLTTVIVSFEAAIAVGFAIASVSNVGQLIAWLDFYIAWRVSRSGTKNQGGGGGKVSPSSGSGTDSYGRGRGPARGPIREMRRLYSEKV
ncbi:hypothetical protein RB598_009532 [Gaeumannomyces tritici]